MKITYDERVDVLRILFSDRRIHENDEEKPGVIFDYDEEGDLIGIELLDASSQVEDPRSVDFSKVTGAPFR